MTKSHVHSVSMPCSQWMAMVRVPGLLTPGPNTFVLPKVYRPNRLYETPFMGAITFFWLTTNMYEQSQITAPRHSAYPAGWFPDSWSFSLMAAWWQRDGSELASVPMRQLCTPELHSKRMWQQVPKWQSLCSVRGLIRSGEMVTMTDSQTFTLKLESYEMFLSPLISDKGEKVKSENVMATKPE